MFVSWNNKIIQLFKYRSAHYNNELSLLLYNVCDNIYDRMKLILNLLLQ